MVPVFLVPGSCGTAHIVSLTCREKRADNWANRACCLNWKTSHVSGEYVHISRKTVIYNDRDLHTENNAQNNKRNWKKTQICALNWITDIYAFLTHNANNSYGCEFERFSSKANQKNSFAVCVWYICADSQASVALNSVSHQNLTPFFGSFDKINHLRHFEIHLAVCSILWMTFYNNLENCSKCVFYCENSWSKGILGAGASFFCIVHKQVHLIFYS